jgi:thiol:disulfide interchange protein DsbC
MFLKRLLICLSCLPLMGALMASAQAAEAAAPDAITSRVEKAFPGVKVSDVQSTPVPGIVEVQVNGSDRAYVTSDGKFMFVGNLYQLDGPKGVVNLTEQRLEVARAAALKQIKPADMVTFRAKGAQKAQVYVFTDVTCPYCEKFHQGIDAINKLGITVHYLAFPRAGLGNKVAEEMNRVWCAEDPQAAMTAAKKHEPVTGAQRDNCLSPVPDQYNLGIELGVRGTPSIMTASGDELGGYLSPAQLAKKLGLNG